MEVDLSFDEGREFSMNPILEWRDRATRRPTQSDGE
jgi:hypothetical protein